MGINANTLSHWGWQLRDQQARSPRTPRRAVEGTGAWIETMSTLLALLESSRRPLARGRGLKHEVEHAVGAEASRPLARGRGLKLSA
jgi:hypothetical protein